MRVHKGRREEGNRGEGKGINESLFEKGEKGYRKLSE